MTSRDPRIYFAAERTLLAWLRTGVAVMAFGFVVARFGVLLQALPGGVTLRGSSVSPYLGAALVGLGVVLLVAGALEYGRYCRMLRPEDLPRPDAARLPLTLTWLLVAIGVVLVIVLLI